MMPKAVYKVKNKQQLDRPERSRYSTEYVASKKKYSSSAAIKYKLTKGYQKYEDIKDAHVKPCEGTHLKTEHHGCTFQPQVSGNKKDRSKSRSVQKFIQDQENYSVGKQCRIKQFRTEATRVEAQECSNRPSIDPYSQRLCTMMNYDKQDVVERLSKKKTRTVIQDDEDLFSPKILQRSKSLRRNKNITELLHSDALRRQQRDQIIENQKMSKDIQSPKINNNTNKLVSRKIYQQFCDLIPENQEKIPIVMAWTVIGELFNIELNPNQSEDEASLCIQMLNYLCKDGDQIVDRKKLWQFIQVIIFKNSCENSVFDSNVEQIISQFGHLYTRRVAKQRTARSPPQYSFTPETLRSSQKYAHKFREKMLEDAKEYITNENTNSNLQSQVKLQDVFMIDCQVKKASLEKKRFQKQQAQLRQCTFKPKINSNKSLKYILPPRMHLSSMKKSENENKLSKISSAKTLENTIARSVTSLSQSVVYQPNSTLLASSKLSTYNSRIQSVDFHKNSKNREISKQKKQKKIEVNVKGLQKSIMNATIGRKARELSNSMKNRGYPDPKEVNNWTRFMEKQKSSVTKEHKKLKGLNNYKKITLR